MLASADQVTKLDGSLRDKVAPALWAWASTVWLATRELLMKIETCCYTRNIR